jgi:hypothetical protein
MRDISAAQGSRNHGEEALRVGSDRSQPQHQTIENGLLGIVVAIADADSSGMTPDARCQEQESEPRSGQRRVTQVSTVASSSRLNNISQQLRKTWQVHIDT